MRFSGSLDDTTPFWETASMRPSTQRLLSILILALWMTPSAMALGVGLHVVLDDHAVLDGHATSDRRHHHEAEHSAALTDLARAAEHGHHHEAEATPDHEHEALFEGASPLSRPNAQVVAMLPLPLSPATSSLERSRIDRPSRRGPPTPLFTANCSLLI